MMLFCWEREEVGRRLCGLYIRSCSGLTSFARARFINVMGTNFFLQKVLPRGFLLYAKRERREEERRGRKVYHFNLTFLRMRVNNTYPMESYFFPLKPDRLVHSMQSASQSERERQTESLPRTANRLSINPSRPAKKGGGSRKELVLLSPPDRSLCTCSLHTAKYLIPTPERALARQDP